MSVDWSVMNTPMLAAFGESVGYYRDGELVRTITAIVDRRPAEPLREAPSALRPMVHVWVANDAETGISATELDTGRDTLRLARRVGGNAEEFTIARVLAQDEGMLQLEVR